MFKNAFSFEGRIRRLEYGLSILIFYSVCCAAIIAAKSGFSISLSIILPTLLIPLVWLLLAQGAKRSHDRGNSGWWQLIPFYHLWMLFADGEIGENIYGKNPKNINH